MTLNCNGKLVDLGQPQVMGIINVNGDSFYSGSRHASINEVMRSATKMIEDGARFLDIGAMSSRPGSEISDPEEEAALILPIIKELVKVIPSHVVLSLDTVHADVAKMAIVAGVDMINDISGGDYDDVMIEVVSQSSCSFVAMHMPGTPSDMQQRTQYQNVTMDLLKYFRAKCKQLEEAGISDFVLDVGFGFGKTVDQNYSLLKQMGSFAMFDRPILAGISRKSMIYKLLGTSPEEALNGTTFAHAYCLQNGANIIRVHDVKEAIECVRIFQALNA